MSDEPRVSNEEASSEGGASDERTFMMGQFAAKFPTDRLYARNQMWALPIEKGWRFGFSAYAVRLLQDVYFLDWTVDVGATLQLKQAIGAIESKKAESELYAPIAGVLRSINRELLKDPSLINVDKYGRGWLFEIEGEGLELLQPDAYLEYLATVWETTQRLIKGQMNE